MSLINLLLLLNNNNYDNNKMKIKHNKFTVSFNSMQECFHVNKTLQIYNIHEYTIVQTVQI